VIHDLYEEFQYNVRRQSFLHFQTPNEYFKKAREGGSVFSSNYFLLILGIVGALDK
jgi:hypothetical protein